MPAVAGQVSHNLFGQRLGRKGLETRERILCAALRLLDAPGAAPLTLASVAREAATGITTLYLYFPDLGDLVLAALQRVMEAAEEAFVTKLRQRWADDALAACALDFLRAHLGFWQRHARILHLRNSLADGGDLRFLACRNEGSRPLLDLLSRQMDDAAAPAAAAQHYATVLMTGFERTATVVTNPNWHITAQTLGAVDAPAYVDQLLRAEARLIAFAIAERRGAAAQP